MNESEKNKHELLIEEIYKIRDAVLDKNKHTGLTNRTVLITVVEMFEKVLKEIK